MVARRLDGHDSREAACYVVPHHSYISSSRSRERLLKQRQEATMSFFGSNQVKHAVEL